VTDDVEFDFAAFPRGDLAIRIDRRQLLRSVVTEMRVAEGKSQGGKAMRLAELGTIPDEHLAVIRPVIVSSCTVEESNGFAWAKLGTFGPRLKLFPLEAPARQLFMAFDGGTSLGELAIRLAEETGWDASHARAYTRGVFLHLISRGVCLPA
jgi:hypothetical protein